VPDHFVISQQLYEIEKLSSCSSVFERVCEGAPAMMLVSGYSGVGKASTHSKLYKLSFGNAAIHRRKIRPDRSHLPFGALIQAFRGFIQQLLTKRKSFGGVAFGLSEALDVNGG
jgi:predicted ATPase